MKDPAQIQKEYYRKTAVNYDDMHLHTGDEHFFALNFMGALIEYYQLKSVLDIGAGTGRTLLWLKKHYPGLEVKGIEPVAALREEGYRKGLRKSEMMEGDGNFLDFGAGDFDLVCEFGMLHHVPKPARIIAEMLRVAKSGVFISDSNNFGQGSVLRRTIKQALNTFGLWRAYDFFRTKGKMYQVNEGDGLFYSYSVFNNFKQIKNDCRSVHLLNTKDGGKNLYATSSHVVLFGVKK